MKKHNGWVSYTDNKVEDNIKLGEQKYNLHNMGFDHQYTARDLTKETLKDLYINAIKCIENGKKHFDGDFYIELERIADRIVPDHERRFFFARVDCPIPFYDQAVYKYNKHKNEVSMLWNLPDIEYAEELRYKISDLKEGERELRENVIKFYNRDLAILAYNENKEVDSKKIII